MNIEKGRRTGRTTRMIESIPNPEEYDDSVKFYVVGFQHDQAQQIVETAIKLRPELKGRLKPYSAQNIKNLQGVWSDMIYIDHYVYEMMKELPQESQDFLISLNTMPDPTAFLSGDRVARKIAKVSLWTRIKGWFKWIL